MSTPDPAVESEIIQKFRKSRNIALILPAILLAFFFIAPRWFNAQIRSEFAGSLNDSELSAAEKEEQRAAIQLFDFGALCDGPADSNVELKEILQSNGICSRFWRFKWAFRLSLLNFLAPLLAIPVIALLNRQASKSQNQLIRNYRLGWWTAVAATAIAVTLSPLLAAFASYEITVLAFEMFVPKLIVVFAITGAVAIFLTAKALFTKVPLEFEDPLGRELMPDEAPELWRAVRSVAHRLNAAPPNHIIVGLTPNFSVTELGVRHSGGLTKGLTLFLSYPILKQLSEEEALAIVGHELGHFAGEDTKLTREFYPMRLKIAGLVAASGSAAWTGCSRMIEAFLWCFEGTASRYSRERELLADLKGAEATSNLAQAKALVRFHMAVEMLERSIAKAPADVEANPFNIDIREVISGDVGKDDEFWTALFQKQQSHPMDTHPPLDVRLKNLGHIHTHDEARQLAKEEFPSAFERWFSGNETLFQPLVNMAKANLRQFHQQQEIRHLKPDTEEGRHLLESHFPEVSWKARAFPLLLTCVIVGALVIALLAGAIFVGTAFGHVFFALAALAPIPALVRHWKRWHNAVLTLNSASLRHSGWERPILFDEVEDISAHDTGNGIVIQVDFHESVPPLWKLSWRQKTTQVFTLSLSNFEGKPVETALKILTYFTREVSPNNVIHPPQ